MSSSPLCITLRRYKKAQKWCLTKRTCCVLNFSSPTCFLPILLFNTCKTIWFPFVITHMTIVPLQVYFLRDIMLFLPHSVRELHPFPVYLSHWFSILTYHLLLLSLLLEDFLSFTFIYLFCIFCVMDFQSDFYKKFLAARNWSCTCGFSPTVSV